MWHGIFPWIPQSQTEPVVPMDADAIPRKGVVRVEWMPDAKSVPPAGCYEIASVNMRAKRWLLLPWSEFALKRHGSTAYWVNAADIRQCERVK